MILIHQHGAIYIFRFDCITLYQVLQKYTVSSINFTKVLGFAEITILNYLINNMNSVAINNLCSFTCGESSVGSVNVKVYLVPIFVQLELFYFHVIFTGNKTEHITLYQIFLSALLSNTNSLNICRMKCVNHCC